MCMCEREMIKEWKRGNERGRDYRNRIDAVADLLLIDAGFSVWFVSLLDVWLVGLFEPLLAANEKLRLQITADCLA